MLLREKIQAGQPQQKRSLGEELHREEQSKAVNAKCRIDALGRVSVIHTVQRMHDAVALRPNVLSADPRAPPPAPGSVVCRENLAYRLELELRRFQDLVTVDCSLPLGI
jgi:hypothetical protein